MSERRQPLATAGEIAKYLNTTREHVYALAREGKISRIKFDKKRPGAVRFFWSDVEKFLREKRIAAK
jgi:excisionase family DNA binding protein